MKRGVWILCAALVIVSPTLWAQPGPPRDTLDVLSISHPESRLLTADDTIEITVRFEVPNIKFRGGDFALYMAAKKRDHAEFVFPKASTAGARVLAESGTVDLSVKVGDLVALGAGTDPLLIWVGLWYREPGYLPPPDDPPPSVRPLVQGHSFAWTVVE